MKREDVFIIKLVFAIVSILMNVFIAPFVSVYIIIKSKPVYDKRSKGYLMGMSSTEYKAFYIYDWQLTLVKDTIAVVLIIAVAILCMYVFSPMFIA